MSGSMTFEERIQNHDITLGVVGLGYVGLPLAVDFASAGFKVIGIDIDDSKIEKINAGENYIQDVSDSELRGHVETGKLSATTDFSVIDELDAISICVPTPLNKLKDPDVSFILNALDEINEHMHKDLIIVLESTTYPGTTRELVLPKLSESGLEVGKDFFLVFSPERVDPGNETYHTKNTPKVLGGITDECTRLGKILYEEVIETIVPVSSTEAAELVKLLENTFRSINIGLVNEMAIMAEKLGVDIWEVIDAADTKPFGFMKFYPGPGLGGHCIPIDPHYLAWKMKTLDYKARFIELAGEINTEMPYHVVQLVMDGLNRYKKSVNGAKILVMGVAYKKNIDDVRESPALDIIRLLQEKGAEVDYYDPFIDNIKLDGTNMESIRYSTDILGNYDCNVIATDHSTFDYNEIVEKSSLVIDTRNAAKVHDSVQKDKIIKLGGNNS
ncbi:MAG: nucleotide sugar dehydrogenase [Candidatus Marinimicrobia bacterium]|nr:nucleotide sugar dehydrogenase [Candidatus Neomarinimicrobiota bacterium]MCF7828562.1 nucleotide sugar dehydrogenase [Candidatus Neomarinimicrobiota bacterium]MCF7880303.1 nucleotide sugar dehydrogenase [Candidatus Neomarinimicrobiota bacterium]